MVASKPCLQVGAALSLGLCYVIAGLFAAAFLVQLAFTINQYGTRFQGALFLAALALVDIVSSGIIVLLTIRTLNGRIRFAAFVIIILGAGIFFGIVHYVAFIAAILSASGAKG